MNRLPRATALFAAIAAIVTVSFAEDPSFTNVSVHDPSVIKVGDRFYVYGSHGASAYTTDLMHWTQVANSMTSGNPVHFRNWKSELSDLFTWTQAETLWAADVYQLDDGKYYYYYNVWTSYLNYRSYMGLAVSDTVEGPYTNVGEILKGGTNLSGFDPAYDPNTIDPCLFRDPDGNLWMVYGSYSGGIFVMAMDETTGLQEAGQEWGTKILNGRGALIEGPFIEYNEDTGYYYLFLSYGGLVSYDDYNMRVFRSENPTGPFLDPAGNNPATAAVSGWKNYGLAFAGGWEFQPVTGEYEQDPTGYLSPGHNSVMKDPATGKWFNFFHTRFYGRGESHEVRVHQFFFNEDGWPVMAPHRYAGETQGSYSEAEIAGSYKAIIHTKVINHSDWVTGGDPNPTYSTVISLNADGSVSSADGGSWSMPDGKNIRITLDGVDYKGVVCEQWDNENRLWVNTFTAVSSNGLSLWGSAVAVADRSGDIPKPDMPEVGNMAIPYDQIFTLDLGNLNDSSGLYLIYELIDSPTGMTIDPDTGMVSWTPLPSQSGVISQVRARVYDELDPSLSDQVQFSIYVANAVSAQGIEHSFDAAGTSGLKDSSGVFTGLTARLSGTGTSFSNDPNLTLDTANGKLLIDTTAADFNGQAGVASATAVGHKLSEFGFTGTEDFTVTAVFGPIDTLEDVDQIGIFVGSSATTLTRAGIIMLPEAQGLGVHTQSGGDTGATFNTSGFDLSDGVIVTISRTDGAWNYVVDGKSVNPVTPNATFLDGLSDLTVGVFAIHPSSGNVKTASVTSLDISVAAEGAAVTRLDDWKTENFGESPAEGVAGNDDDPDGDGLSNLLEYALGTDPNVMNLGVFNSIVASNGKVVLTFPRRDDPALTFTVKANPDLQTESDSEIWQSAGEDNLTSPAEVLHENAFEATDKNFYQLSVETIE